MLRDRLVVSLIVLLVLSWIIALIVCKTPDGRDGKCIDIDNCEELKKAWNSLSLTSKNVTEELVNRSKCVGRYQNIVCCPTWDPTMLMPEESVCENDVYERIFGGSEASIDTFPWTVMIEGFDAGDQLVPFCGGSLINNRYVVTAAHCYYAKLQLFSVLLGEHDTRTLIDCQRVAGGKDCNDLFVRAKIETFILHSSYEYSNAQHDIALIRMDRFVTFTDFIKPICLPKADITVNTSRKTVLKFEAAGWGITENGNSSYVKKIVRLPYINATVCKQIYRTSENVICAGGVTNQDTCNGDSGGPLVYLRKTVYELVGIVSTGPKPCGQKNMPALYTKVFAYKDWILNQMQPFENPTVKT